MPESIYFGPKLSTYVGPVFKAKIYTVCAHDFLGCQDCGSCIGDLWTLLNRAGSEARGGSGGRDPREGHRGQFLHGIGLKL